MVAPIDLHAHSTFSLQDGFGSPESVVERAKELGWTAASLSEHGSLASAPAFYKACKEHKVKPIISCELYSVHDLTITKEQSNSHLTAIALSKEGYHNLVAWTTFASQRENFYRKPRISPEKMAEVAPYPLHHNAILSGCLGSVLSQFAVSGADDGLFLAGGIPYVDAMRSLFPNFYLELQNHYNFKFYGVGFGNYNSMVDSEAINRERLIRLHELTGCPLVITNDSHMQRPDQRQAHLAMKASAWRQRDDEHHSQSSEKLISSYKKDYIYYMSYMRDMEQVADGIPYGKDALQNVSDIVEEASINLDAIDSSGYSIPYSGYSDPFQKIRDRSRVRLGKLIEKHGQNAQDRFDHELESMGDFAHYLLLMSDFIIFAKRQGILTNTRGSAASSILCYCLRIHDIDSIKWGLTFERFYNPSRKKLPDIDIDIERDRFEDFIQHVKETLAPLEGEGQVVPISTYGSFANRSSFRAVADALGINEEVKEQISKLLPTMMDSGMVDEDDNPFDLIKEEYSEIYSLTSGVFDSLRSVGRHPCGWLFGTKERSIEEWVPLCLIASSNSLVTQYDLESLSDMGLVKGDFLRLKTLSVIKRVLGQIGWDVLKINKIPLGDPETFQMLREGRTEGLFQLQGKENRRGCIETEVSSVEDVIATIALYRPAATRPGYHKVYNKRRKGLEEIQSIHPIVDGILESTYGLFLYQEQLLDLGYALGMDHLQVEGFLSAIKESKGTGRGAKEAFEKLRPMYEELALQHMGKEEAKALWTFIGNYAGYSFNKAHSTAYGLLAVRSAYLKRHFPQEYFSSLLDVYPEKSKYVVAAQVEGFKFLKPCINQSRAGFSKGKGKNEIRVGLSRIKGFGPGAVANIIAGQPYSSYEDFKERTSSRIVHKTRVEALASVGALNCVGIKEDESDLTQFQLLSFNLDKPKAFKGIKPRYAGPRDTGRTWKHKGLYSGAELTQGAVSISKLFWIPPLSMDKKQKPKLLEVKASAWAKVKATLLLAIDENGLAYHIVANEDRPILAKTLEYLAKNCTGAVICLDGAVRQPFLNDGPFMFRLFNITGGYRGSPQVFRVQEKHYKNLVKLSSFAK